MNLVKTASSSYINMDTIESICEYVKNTTYGTAYIKCVRCISGEVYEISKEAYDIILKYE